MTITVFLSFAEQLGREREQVAAWLAGAARIAARREIGIKIDPAEAPADRVEAAAAADLSLFVFLDQFPESARAEYGAALAAWRSQDGAGGEDARPSISLWFKAPDGRAAAEPRDHLYANLWTSPEGLGLGVLSQVARLAPRLALTVEDAHASLDGEPLIDIGGLELYTNFDDLGARRREEAELERRVEALVEAWADGPEATQTAEDELDRLENQAGAITELIVEAEDELGAMIAALAEATRPGADLAPTEAEAWQLAQQGLFDAALDRLDSQTLREQSRDALDSSLPDSLGAAARSWLQRLELLRSRPRDEAVEAAVEEALEQAAGLEQRHHLDDETAFYLAQTLASSDRDDQAADIYQAIWRTSAEGVDIRLRTAALAALVGRLTLLERPDEAVALLGEARQFLQDQADARDSRGNLLAVPAHTAVALLWTAVDRPEEGEAELDRAAALLRPLASSDVALHGRDLARVLRTAAIIRQARQRPVEALAALAEVAELYRRLAQIDPAAYAGRLADALHGIGREQVDQGELEAASAAVGEAVEIYRRIAGGDPAAHGQDLMAALFGLATIHLLEGRDEPAEALLTEAADFRRRLPDDALGDLVADSGAMLSALAGIYRRTGRADQADAALSQAVDLLRPAALIGSTADRIDCALALTRLGALRNQDERYEEAETALTEAAEMYRRIGPANSGAVTPGLARVQSELAMAYLLTDRPRLAEPALREAVSLYSAAAKADPDYRVDVAENLRELGKLYHDARRLGNAEKAMLKAAEIYNSVAKRQPEHYEDLIRVHEALADVYDHQDRAAKRVAALRRAVGHARTAAAADPTTYRPMLAEALAGLGGALFEEGKTRQAAPPVEEAVAIYRQLVESGNREVRPDLAVTLTNLGTLYSHLGRATAAQAVRAEADLL
ncbi:MAG: tetratricopeptide repeat protein [Bifidobacteriaceae bacterium]|jgi:hypothetical protein|nr:tetratricopeptide repeat protein [Bifidobacteriaceae bacterium]